MIETYRETTKEEMQDIISNLHLQLVERDTEIKLSIAALLKKNDQLNQAEKENESIAKSWSHELKVNEKLRAQNKVLREALEMIKDNPTGDSTGIVNNTNNWTSWAKNFARAALAVTNKGEK